MPSSNACVNTDENQNLIDSSYKNPELDDVKFRFEEIKEKGTKYGDCKAKLNLAVHNSFNFGQSHFQGVAKYQDILVFSHNNEGGDKGRFAVTDSNKAKYLPNQDSPSSRTDYSEVVKSQKNWTHPGGIQASGKLMVCGIQKVQTDPEKSKIVFKKIGSSKLEDLNHLTIEKGSSGFTCAGITHFDAPNGQEGFLVAGVTKKEIRLWYSENQDPLDSDCCDEHYVRYGSTFSINHSAQNIFLLTEQSSGDRKIYMIAINENNDKSMAWLYRLNMEKIRNKESEGYSDNDCYSQLSTKEFNSTKDIHFSYGTGAYVIPSHNSNHSTKLELFATEMTTGDDWFRWDRYSS